MSELEQNNQPKKYSRREIVAHGLAYTAIATATVRLVFTPGFWIGVAEDLASIHIGKLDPENATGVDKERLIHDLNQFQQHNTFSDYLQTTLLACLESFATYAGGVYTNEHILENSKYKVGKPEQPKRRDEFTLTKNLPSNASETVGTVLAIPILTGYVLAVAGFEEVIFRKAIESTFVNANDSSLALNIGIPSSALFALMHNLQHNLKWKQIKQDGVEKVIEDFFASSFDTKSIPLQQFIAGLFFWYLLRTKGIVHSTLAHTESNMFGLGVGIADELRLRWQRRGQRADVTTQNPEEQTPQP